MKRLIFARALLALTGCASPPLLLCVMMNKGEVVDDSGQSRLTMVFACKEAAR